MDCVWFLSLFFLTDLLVFFFTLQFFKFTILLHVFKIVFFPDESLLNAFSAHVGITIASLTASEDDYRVEMKEALRLIKNQKKYLDQVDNLL